MNEPHCIAIRGEAQPGEDGGEKRKAHGSGDDGVSIPAVDESVCWLGASVKEVASHRTLYEALDLLEVGVAFDELFCAAAGEADAQAAVFVVAFDSNHGPHTIFCVPNFLTK
jgi:hypothetical protein